MGTQDARPCLAHRPRAHVGAHRGRRQQGHTASLRWRGEGLRCQAGLPFPTPSENPRRTLGEPSENPRRTGMSEHKDPQETARWQRKLAPHANNRAWALAEQTSRTSADDDEVLQAAHAAAFFWKIVGKPSQVAHAHQLLAHVYAFLNLPKPARHHLRPSEPFFLEGSSAPLGSGVCPSGCRPCRQRSRRSCRAFPAASGGCGCHQRAGERRGKVHPGSFTPGCSRAVSLSRCWHIEPQRFRGPSPRSPRPSRWARHIQ
jgi:hypothetical protein